MTPIKGVTDLRRLPRTGKIHLGHKVQGGKGEYPKQTPYFVVRADDTTSQDAARAFWEIYGEQPKELDIVFPSDDPMQWADANYKAYSQQWALRCKGNGETALAKWDPDSEGPQPAGIESGTWATRNTKEWAYMEVPCAGSDCPMQKFTPAKCKAVMNLQFILRRVPGLGIWQIDTGSWHSIQNVQNNVELIRAMTGGRIRGLELKLRLTPKEVTPTNTGTKTVYVLDIYTPITVDDLMRRVAELPERGLMLLPAPDDEVPEDLFPDAVDRETGEIIEAEPAQGSPEAHGVDPEYEAARADALTAEPHGGEELERAHEEPQQQPELPQPAEAASE
ncbi:hypothetical protein LCGC14_1555540 [marine sediment metagenome]|uniref:Uncharacterized protein n=1 Tax=marine sediment metagenome TaxID=412755 RepID=A0A0F9IP25_9ZZZZ